MIPPGFGEFLKLQRNSIISVLASNIFKKSDYIKDYNKLNTKREISFNGTHHCNEALKMKFTQILENVIDKNELVLGKSVRVFEKNLLPSLILSTQSHVVMGMMLYFLFLRH